MLIVLFLVMFTGAGFVLPGLVGLGLAEDAYRRRRAREILDEARKRREG